jgi:glycosyltransferase involved in cell wall biosynthesis
VVDEPPLAVVVPAHNEAAVIGRLLSALSDRNESDEVVVVCDGCTDDTASVARSFPGVFVVEQTRGGKPSALNTGDRVARIFPRFYVDADIIVTTGALRAVGSKMVDGVEAGAPRIAVDLAGASWAVRRFYAIWTRLPYATEAVIGSGVIGMTEGGRRRFGDFPDVIGDDEYVRRLFAVEERVRDVHETFVVTAPRRLAPLIRIKTRSRLGILQLDELHGPAPAAAGQSGRSVLLRLVRDPRLWPSLVVFGVVRLVVAVRAHIRLRRGQFSGWARDDSSRVLGIER